MKLREPRVFTLEEAKQTLPFVKRIIADIIHINKEISNLDEKIRQTKNLKERRERITDRQRLIADQKEFQQELDMVGCHLKNPRTGIVSYYWDRGDGFIVELCWKYDEEDFRYWNEIGSNKLIPLDLALPEK